MANSSLIQYKLHKDICFMLQLTFDFGCCFCYVLGRRPLFTYFYWRASETGGKGIYPLWPARAFVRWNAWSDERRTSFCIGARSIVHLAICAIHRIILQNSLHCTAVASRRKIYSKIHCVNFAQRCSESWNSSFNRNLPSNGYKNISHGTAWLNKKCVKIKFKHLR